MQKVDKFIKYMKSQDEETKHSFAVLVAFVLTAIVGFCVVFSWYITFYDYKIENTLLTRIVSWFQ
jgi:hypothetical protein